jgi:hypothetical protein
MLIVTELCCKRYNFLTKKTQNYRYQNYCLDDNIQIYSYGLLCEHVLSMRMKNDWEKGNMLGLPINNNQAKSLSLQREIWRVALPWVRSIQQQRFNWSPTYNLHLLINICNFAPGNSKLLSMSSIKRPYLRGKQTQILRDQQRGNGSAKRSNRSPTYILHLFHLEDTSLLFLFICESVKVRFLPRVDSFSFAQEPHVVYCF